MPLYFDQLTNVDINSFSAGLMLGTTLYRNQAGLYNKVGAQIGYGLITVIALVESAVALPFVALSLVLLPLSFGFISHSFSWLTSSLFCVVWSAVDFIFNPFCDSLIADEQSVRLVFAMNNPFVLPPNALV